MLKSENLTTSMIAPFLRSLTDSQIKLRSLWILQIFGSFEAYLDSVISYESGCMLRQIVRGTRNLDDVDLDSYLLRGLEFEETSKVEALSRLSEFAIDTPEGIEQCDIQIRKLRSFGYFVDSSGVVSVPFGSHLPLPFSSAYKKLFENF